MGSKHQHSDRRLATKRTLRSSLDVGKGGTRHVVAFMELSLFEKFGPPARLHTDA